MTRRPVRELMLPKPAPDLTPSLVKAFRQRRMMRQIAIDFQKKNLGGRASRPPHVHEGETPSLHQRLRTACRCTAL